ncbi:TonB-dependent siderophore receptor [Corallococcus sp. AB032C]|uniref:TonB-dependent siderophore receptor n=1 Tax=Corallococcus TaxID=83461 RepID=UPI000EE7C823|nr:MULTISPECIES: TonB-dependent siderophore receptor [Corallococcus]NNB84946.1 TonB-dependent siderophore receptor [Corallococcus exiguus]NPC47052.1 TonB-dependent siderophore receptor [Corallococcus exiguus]RKH86076.1 TonB-dependent siderophore receptor [Corallococcus sp. AB032C]
MPTLFRSRPRSLVPGALLGASISLLASPALAQEPAAPQEAPAPETPAPAQASNPEPGAAPADDGVYDLPTVVVESERANGPVQGYTARRSGSGTKTDTAIGDTPQSVSVVGRAQMDAQQVQSVTEATRYTPGVRSDTFGADPRNDWFLIRGFTSQEGGYFLDGLQLYSSSFATWRLETFGLERVETVRGPSSVLYGGTSPGGLLNMVGKRPPVEGHIRHVELSVNEFANGYAAVDFGGAIDSGNHWRYRVTALARGGGTQVEETDNNRLFIAPALTWAPSDNTALTLHGSFLADRTQGQNFLPYVGTVVDAPYGRIPTDLFTSDKSLDHFQRNQSWAGYEFSHRFNDTFTLRQNLRYAHLDLDFQTLYGVGYVGEPADAQLSRGNFVTRPTANLFSVDTQGDVRFSTGPVRHLVLAGVDFKNYVLNDEQGYEAGAPLDLLNPVRGDYTPTESRYTLNQSTQNQLGVYLQDQLRIGDRLSLVLSGRHDWVGMDVDNELAPTANYDGSESAFSGRAGLLYRFDFGVAPYVSFSKSFNPVAGTKSDGSIFEPEKGQQLEAGVKYQPDAFPVLVGLSVFELKRQNFVTTDGSFNQLQIGEVRSRGFEVEANATLMHGLSLIGSASLYSLEITEGADFELGKRPVGVPEVLASLWLDYTFQDGALRGFGAAAGVRGVGSSFADRENTLDVPGFTLVDASVHFERGPWRAAVNASNLGDKTYVSSCSSATACFYGERRRASATVGYTW